MADEKDYDTLKKKEQELAKQKKDCEKTSSEINDQISRLKEARDKIGEYKEDIDKLCFIGIDKTARWASDSPSPGVETWMGYKYREFDDFCKNTLVPDINKLCKEINTVQDGIDGKISELQKSLLSNDTCMNDIKYALNNVWKNF